MKKQNMDEMLLTEYKSIHQEDLPDLWSRIEDKIQSQENINPNQENVNPSQNQDKKQSRETESGNEIQFRKLGTKRLVQLIGSIAACLLIVVSYVYMNGDIRPLSEWDVLPIGDAYENATPTESSPTESSPTEAAAESVAEDVMTPTEAESVEDMGQESVRVESEEKLPSFDELRAAGDEIEPIYLKVQEIWYCYDGAGQLDASVLEGKELLGETVPAETKELPSHNLEITVVTFPCRVYANVDNENVVYVEVMETGEVYGFVSIE